MSTAETPMLRQYLEIKSGYQDAILFFRLGDFYEMFLEDAKVASKELELTLTGRGKDENRIPMCGVPHHASETYIARLVAKGYKVAICEQVEEATAGKGITKREVVKVITPGTVLGQGMLEETENNYLFAVASIPNTSRFGVSFVDITTGEFRLFVAQTRADLMACVTRLNPKEVVIQEGEDLELGEGILITPMSFSDSSRSENALLQHFRLNSLSAFGIDPLKEAFPAAWALLSYVISTQKHAVPQVAALLPFHSTQTLQMDRVTLKNLELTESREKNQSTETLFWVLNDTKTAMGARKLKAMIRNPLVDEEAITHRWDALDALKNDLLSREEIRDCLAPVYDLERLVARVVSDHHNPRDLIALKQSIQAVADLPSILPHLSGKLMQDFEAFFASFQTPDSPYKKIITLIETSIQEDSAAHIREGNVIKPGFSQVLDELLLSFKTVKDWIGALEEVEREATGIKSLKVGFNRVFGYYIEVPQSQSGAVPEHYIRKQTLANAERYMTPELKEKEIVLLHGEEKQRACEVQIYEDIVREVKTHIGALQRLAQQLSLLDALQSLASVAQKNGYCRPVFAPQSARQFSVKMGRHPVLEKKKTSSFIPNDLEMNENTQSFILITGPNMAGKSTLMRQVALWVVMAQMGSFVSASSMTFSVVDQLFTRIGALDNLYFGQSTFMVEMLETASIINNASASSLIILDEIGRGTSTYDGMSIAVAVTEHLHTQIGARTLFATHYHELTSLEHNLKGLKNFNMQILETKEDIVFTYKLIAGPADKSYGIHVAKMAGLPSSVVSRANGVLQGLESHGLQYLKPAPKLNQPSLFPEV